MHASIFQLSTKPISKEDWASESTFEEGVGIWCDYVREEKGDDRKCCIANLHGYVSEIFGCDAEGSLVLTGDLEKFREKWALAIRQSAAEITGKTIFANKWRLSKLTERTHLFIYDMFYIKDEGTFTFAELMEYVAAHLKKDDRLYIGAIYDFHY